MPLRDPGTLNRVVIVKKPTRTPDGAGGFAEDFAAIDFGERYAAVEPVSGLRRVRGAKAQATSTHLVTMRFAEDIDGTIVLDLDGRILKPTEPPRDLDERHEWMEFFVREERA